MALQGDDSDWRYSESWNWEFGVGMGLAVVGLGWDVERSASASGDRLHIFSMLTATDLFKASQ